MPSPARMTNGTAIKGISASGPAMSEITHMKKKMKGRSTMATNVAEVKNSLSVSNSRTMLAIAPDFCRRLSSFIDRILSKIRRDMRASARFPALSTNCALSVLMMKSNPSAIRTPMVSAISDSIASLGTTRS